MCEVGPSIVKNGANREQFRPKVGIPQLVVSGLPLTHIIFRMGEAVDARGAARRAVDGLAEALRGTLDVDKPRQRRQL